ncbi:hypothetical protein B0919_18610 [Hymenobacter sp. CRA2]|nr:hypothetical protein B0919_18610 [Hymenobacter sp. CRA2]
MSLVTLAATGQSYSVPNMPAERPDFPRVSNYGSSGASWLKVGEGSYVLAGGQVGKGMLRVATGQVVVEPEDGSKELRLAAREVRRVVIAQDTFDVLGGVPDLHSQQPIERQVGRRLHSRSGYVVYRTRSIGPLLGPQLSGYLLCLPDGRQGYVPARPAALRNFLQPLFGQCPSVQTRMAAQGFGPHELTNVMNDYLAWQAAGSK